MKKLNVILILILILLVSSGLYTLAGAKMTVQASAAASGSDIECRLFLTNGSVLNFDYIEFIPRSPEGARIASPQGEGETLRALSQGEASFTLTGSSGEGAQVEVGYYVLGIRRKVMVNIH